MATNNRFLILKYFFISLVMSVPAQLHANQDETLTYDDGSSYVGTIKNGAPDGKGSLTYVDGTIYKGVFKNGMIVKGVALFSSGNRYEGEFNKNKPDGMGVFSYPDGERYEGHFVKGKRDGKGIKIYLNGDRYEGEFINNKYDGKGVKTYVNGTIFKGVFKNGRQVKGVKTFSSGTRYEGEFIKGKLFGKGIKIYSNGTRYEGEFEGGKLHGKGIKLYASGNRYEGEFKNNRFDGNGVLAFVSGTIHKGVFKNGRIAQGVELITGGDRYEGNFKNGRRDGKGVYTSTNGDRYEGDHKEGKMDGKGVYTFASGNQLRGSFKANKFLDYPKIAKVKPSVAKVRPSSKKISNDAQKNKEAYIRKLINKNSDIKNAFLQVSHSSQVCKQYRSVKSDVLDIECDSSKKCDELQDDLAYQIKRDGREACAAGKLGKKDLVSSLGKDNEGAINNVLYVFKNDYYVKNTVKDDYSGAIKGLKNAVREEERLAREAKENKTYESSAIMGALSSGLKSISESMPSTKEILKQNQKTINESYRKAKSKIKKSRSKKSVKRYKKPLYNRSALNSYKKKLSSIDLEGKCKARGGSFDARINNCTIRKTIQTAVLHNGGVNSIYGNKPVPGTLNYRAKPASKSKNKSSGNSSSIKNKNKNSKNRKQTASYKIDEAKALCWTWRNSRGKNRWLCAGPVQRLLVSEATEEKALRYVGCKSYRKKFHNVRFSARSGKQYKYDKAFIYGCGKPFNKYDYKIDKSFSIKYPASVILTKFTCSSDAFLGNYSKYCK